MKTNITRLTTFILGILFIGIASNTLAQKDWHFEQVTDDNIRDKVSGQAFKVDADNNLHLVFEKFGESSHDIYYTKRPCGEYWTQPVKVNEENTNAFKPALAVDSQNVPYVFYEIEHPDSIDLHLAHMEDNNWNYEVIVDQPKFNLMPSIDIDDQGKIHLAWIGPDSKDSMRVWYAHNDMGIWMIQKLGFTIPNKIGDPKSGPECNGANPCIRANSEQIAHIVYRGGAPGFMYIHHAYNTMPFGMMWEEEIVETENLNDFYGMIEIDDEDNIHFAASGNDGDGFPDWVYYRQFSDGNWSEPEKVNNIVNGPLTSMTLDKEGNAHITYDELGGYILMGNIGYANNIGGTFSDTLLLIDSLSMSGVVQVDGNMNVHVAHHWGETNDENEIRVISDGYCGGTTGIEEQAIKEQGFAIYPNPADEFATLRFNSEASNKIAVRVYNLTGKLVKELSSQKLMQKNTVTIDISSLTKGIYMVQLTNGDQSYTNKLLVK
ncbi:MAG: T9SS type A sorting domain-containing protein [Bacteroidales bacterium]|nr:T9SS type A sorting domain-containing protein [Bacteroidales bacterium]